MALENYIIRVLRRDEGDPERLTGLLESVEGETQYPFYSLNDLRALLVSANGPERRAKKRSETNN